MKHLTTLFFVLLFPLCVMAQEVFEWENPSFEENERGAMTTPSGWSKLTDESIYSAGDIQPGFFGCVTTPYSGDNYLGLVMRYNGTFEGVYQSFEHPFLKDSFYTFSIWAARSDEYASPTLISNSQMVKFNTPATLVILGINEINKSKFEFLAQSQVIIDTIWQRIEFTFKPRKKSYRSLAIAVLPEGDELPNQNGNVIIDNISPVIHLPLHTFSDTTLSIQKKANNIYFSHSGNIEINDHWFKEKRIYSDWIFYSFSGENIKSSKDAFYVDELNQRFKDGTPTIEKNHLYLTADRFNHHFGVGQVLPHPIAANSSFEIFVNLSSKDNKMADGHLLLKLWGGTPDQPRQELLDQTQTINHESNKTHRMYVRPTKSNWEFIFFEATVATESKPYNGNLTINYISDLIRLKY